MSVITTLPPPTDDLTAQIEALTAPYPVTLPEPAVVACSIPETASFDEIRTVFSVQCYGPEDHLGSTRMVLADDASIVEATMYTPYGVMSEVEANNSPLAVREKFTTKEFDEDGGTMSGVGDGLNLYYFGARYYDPEVGIWLTTDKAGQFASGYLYTGNGTNPVIMVDEDGNFIVTAMLIGAAIGAVVGGGTYSVQAATTGNWNTQMFWKSVGMGALGGAISGGVGSFGTSLATNTAYSVLGNMTSYGISSAITGNFSAGQMGGAIVGGLVGGFLPGVSAVSGGALRNAANELIHNSFKGAMTGAISGMTGAAIDSKGDWNAIGAGFFRGIGTGALGGALATTAKIAIGGATVQWTESQNEKIEAAEAEMDVKQGSYSSVQRRGGWLAKGFSMGRNSINGHGDDVGAEEGIHYLQQIKQGPMKFYTRGFYEQVFMKNNPYSTAGTNEYQAYNLSKGLNNVTTPNNKWWGY